MQAATRSKTFFAAVALFGLVLRGLWVAGIAVTIVAAVIAVATVATVAAIACNGALGVIAAVLLAGIIRIICLCGVGGVHSAAAHIGVTGLLCLGLFRLSARWLPVIILRAAIIIKTRIIIFTHEKISPLFCRTALWGRRAVIHGLAEAFALSFLLPSTLCLQYNR